MFSFEPYGIAYPRGDPAFADAVERTLRALAESREIVWIYDRWFVRPLPGGRSVDMPMSVELRRSFELHRTAAGLVRTCGLRGRASGVGAEEGATHRMRGGSGGARSSPGELATDALPLPARRGEGWGEGRGGKDCLGLETSTAGF